MNAEKKKLGRSKARRGMTRYGWAALAILIVAAGLRIYGLGEKSLWMDEIFTVHKASMSFGDMMKEITTTDAHPPLFQTVEWLWLRVTPLRGDAYVRIPSLLAGIAAVWLMMAIGRRLLGKNAALIAGAVAALSWFQIYFSQEARLYSLVMALVLAQLLLLLKILAKRGKAGWGLWIAFGLAGLATLYTYSLCVLTFGLMALLYLWMERRGRRQWTAWFVTHAAAGLIFLPAGLQVQELSAKIARNMALMHEQPAGLTAGKVVEGISTWMAGPHQWQLFNNVGRLGFAIGAAGILIGTISLLSRRGRRPLKIVGGLFAAILLGYALLPMPRLLAYDAKHLAYLQPLLLLALAAGIRARGAKWGTLLILAALIVTIPMSLFGLKDYYKPDYQKEDWRTLVADVKAKENPDADAIFFSPRYCAYAFIHYAGKIDNGVGADRLESPATRLAPEIRRIWLIECRSPVAVPYPEAYENLERRGWVEQDTKSYPDTLGTLRWTLFVPKANR